MMGRTRVRAPDRITKWEDGACAPNRMMARPKIARPIVGPPPVPATLPPSITARRAPVVSAAAKTARGRLSSCAMRKDGSGYGRQGFRYQVKANGDSKRWRISSYGQTIVVSVLSCNLFFIPTAKLPPFGVGARGGGGVVQPVVLWGG